MSPRDNFRIPMAAPSPEERIPAGQFAKPIEVDDEKYMPGVGIKDWAEEFQEYGGEA